ncbi:hypothetical protein CJJ09_002058 [Candidozyma auris]|nr:hypothetical protein CJJ09_002058 [[Candida] auris]
MTDFLKPKETNPRGIPKAPFIEKVESVVTDPSNYETIFSAFSDRLQQYKYMELSKKQQLADLNIKIPDAEKNLEVIELLKQKKNEEDEDKCIETNYELDSTLYTKATIDAKNLNSVYLWLGAEVMLEYPLDEAVELLNSRLESHKKQLKMVEEDLEF